MTASVREHRNSATSDLERPGELLNADDRRDLGEAWGRC
jgi:hypothetical protein